MEKTLKIGWAQTSITPNRPVRILGQMYERISEYVHDPVTATALALDNGEDQAILVSLDMTEVPMHAIHRISQLIKVVPGLDSGNISYHVTHTHNSSDFFGDFLRDDFISILGEERLPHLVRPDNLLDGEEASVFLSEKIAALISRAWNNRTNGGISWGHEYAAVGFNRRPVFEKDGRYKAVMYGDCSVPDFKSFEGGTDTSAEMLYIWNDRGDLTGIAINIPCPSQVYELHRFISADYWAPVRNAVREVFGNIYILPICGAAGDLSPLDLVQISKQNKETLKIWGGQTSEVFRNFDMTELCNQIAFRIRDAVVRGYEKARNYINQEPVFVHNISELKLPIRMVSESEYLEAQKYINDLKMRFSADHLMEMSDVVKAFEPQGTILRWQFQQEQQEYKFPAHFLRIGDTALATNPFELFCEYGLRIKARLLAEHCMIAQLANGIGGYLPTRTAIGGGSYSSHPASTLCGPEAGDMLVEETVSCLNSMWK